MWMWVRSVHERWQQAGVFVCTQTLLSTTWVQRTSWLKIAYYYWTPTFLANTNVWSIFQYHLTSLLPNLQWWSSAVWRFHTISVIKKIEFEIEIDWMTVCYVTGVVQSGKLIVNYHQAEQFLSSLWSILVSFSSLFWLYGSQLNCFGEQTSVPVQCQMAKRQS